MNVVLSILGVGAGLVALTWAVRSLRLAARRDYFEGKAVVITGASRGIGRGLAHALARRGARLVLAARREDQLGEVAAECEALNPGIETLVVPTDVTDEAQIASLVEQTEGRFGRIDILVNNGGILQGGALSKVSFESFRRTFEVNVLGAVRLTQMVLPIMLRQRSGHIILMSSVMGEHAMPFCTSYSASKHALSGFGEGLRRELAGTGVRVLTVKPGYTQTDMVEVAQRAYRRMGFFKMIPVERVVRRTLDGIVLGRAMVYIGGLETLGGWVNRLFPRLIDVYWRLIATREFEEIVSGQYTE